MKGDGRMEGWGVEGMGERRGDGSLRCIEWQVGEGHTDNDDE